MYKSKLVQFKELVIRVDSMVDQLTIQMCLQSQEDNKVMVTFSRTRQGVAFMLGIHIASKADKDKKA